MNEEIRARKISLGTNWVKTDSGSTFLCPAGIDVKNASEEEIRTLCVNESHNPQND